MAKKMDKTPVKMGYLIKVANVNTAKTHSSAEAYYALKLEDENGDNEFWMLLTPDEVVGLNPVYLDIPRKLKPGRLYYAHTVGKSWRAIVRLVLPAPTPSKDTDIGESIGRDVIASNNSTEFVGRDIVVSIGKALVDRARKRAEQQPCNVPKMSWLRNLRD